MESALARVLVLTHAHGNPHALFRQNAEDEIYTDFKYWEDMSDVLKEDGSGTCLPCVSRVDAT